MDRKHFEALDGLRGIAAVCVLVMHLTLWFSPTTWLSGAGLAVDFFFCLSGFVIAHAYGHKIEAGMGLGNFLWVRIKRLYPLLVLSFAIAAGYYLFKFEAVDHHQGLGDVWSVAKSFCLSLVLIPHEDSSIGYGIFPLNNASWSLFFEFMINIIYCLALILLGRKQARWAFIVLCLPIPFFALRYQTFLQGFTLSGLPVGAARVAISFFIGVLLHDYTKSRANGLTTPNACFPVLATVLVGTIVVETVMSKVWFELFVIVLVFPLIIFLGSTLRRGKLDGVMKVLGEISYPLYILHEPLSYATVAVGKRLPFFHGASDPKLLICTGLASIAVSWALLKLYDEPVRALLKRPARPATLESSPAPHPSR